MLVTGSGCDEPLMPRELPTVHGFDLIVEAPVLVQWEGDAVDAVTQRAIVPPWTEFTVGWSVRNGGDSASVPVELWICASTAWNENPPDCPASSSERATAAIPALAPGAAVSGSVTIAQAGPTDFSDSPVVLLPPPDTVLRLRAHLDPHGAAGDPVHHNNTAASTAAMLAVPQPLIELTVPDTVQAGTPFEAEFTLVNHSRIAPLEGDSLHFCLTESDARTCSLWGYAVPGIAPLPDVAPGGAYSGTATLLIPAGAIQAERYPAGMNVNSCVRRYPCASLPEFVVVRAP